MKIKTCILSLFIACSVSAQTDTIPSGVYNWSLLQPQKTQGRESRQVLKGSTSDLAGLSIHTSTLEAGQTNHPTTAYDNREELVIVKDGELKVTINNVVKTLGRGGLALIIAGDEQSFTNTSGKPATYYVLSFTSKSPVNIQRGKQAGGSVLKNWDELVTTKTDKGESRQVFDRPSSMFSRFSIHATALNPGLASHLPHTHRAEEIMLLMNGNVQAQIGQALHNVVAGDVIIVAPYVLHALKNTGSEQCGYFAIQWLN